MKALSIRQPRAEQVIYGEVTADLRSWQVSYRGPLAIHASSERADSRCRALGLDPDSLAYGAVIGTVDLTEIVALDEASYAALASEHRNEGPFPGAPCYAWRFSQPQRLPEPVPARGRMSLFNVDLPGAARSDDFSRSTEASQPQTGRPQRGRPQGVDPTYRVTPEPSPDPARPFVLYAIPEAHGGYRAALYQWLAPKRPGQTGAPEPAADGGRAPGALWGIEVGGDLLRGLADHLLAALRANGYKATDLAAPREAPFYLDEASGLRLALIFLAAKPLTRGDRIETVGQGVQAMSDEEAYYWFSKCSAGPHAGRAQHALRVLLAGE